MLKISVLPKVSASEIRETNRAIEVNTGHIEVTFEELLPNQRIVLIGQFGYLQGTIFHCKEEPTSILEKKNNQKCSHNKLN